MADGDLRTDRERLWQSLMEMARTDRLSFSPSKKNAAPSAPIPALTTQTR